MPIALKAIDIMSIQQGRDWGVASLNEMRSFFGMVRHKTFMDINSDPGMIPLPLCILLLTHTDIATSLEALYGDVDNVELYPGVVVGLLS